MPANTLTICNATLLKLGARVITALDNPTKEAELCLERYPRLRDALLRGHPWTFAKANTTLNQFAASTLPPWLNEFALPTGIARIRSISDAAGRPLDCYELSSRKIHCDEPVIVLRYIQSYDTADDNAEFPDDFAESLACLIASDICVSLNQNVTMRETYLQEHMMTLSAARFNGAIELGPQALIADEWLNAHQGFYSPAPYPDKLA